MDVSASKCRGIVLRSAVDVGPFVLQPLVVLRAAVKVSAHLRARFSPQAVSPHHAIK